MASEENARLIETLRSGPSVVGLSVEEFRRLDDEFIASLPPLPDDVTLEETPVAGLPADRIAAAGADSRRVMLYLHGGGYMSGSRPYYRDLAGRLSRACGMPLLVLEYRLAPEHPFPAAVDDALAAWHALLAGGFEHGHVVVAGDSAGGGLTLALFVALRDAGEPLPAAGVLLSAWTDLTCSADSVTTRAAIDPAVPPEMVRWMADLYLQGQDPTTPLASPIFADPRGLPPLLVQVGSAEILLDDSTVVAERARAAGVDVTLEVWDDMVHVWHLWAETLPEGRQAIERIGEYVRERTSPATTVAEAAGQARP